MRRAVYAGSFDPMTNGHLWMVERGAELFDELVVAIGVNIDKKYTFSVGERMTMLKSSLAAYGNVRIDTMDEDEKLVAYAKRNEATHILRGIRDVRDFEYERGMRNLNADFEPGIVSCFLMPPRELADISSSAVKSLVGFRGWEKDIRGYVPQAVYRRMLERFELKRWRTCFSEDIRISGQPRIDETYAEILRRYSEPHRAYHNLIHIINCLIELDEVRGLLEYPRFVELALWFHDLVYDTHCHDNEEQSATRAKQALLQIGCSTFETNAVTGLILATKDHVALPQPDAQYLIDIDLAILGQSEMVFDAYEAQISKEYDWVPPEIFRAKRTEVLQTFLDPKRSSIYLTDHFREKYEKQARENLARSLAKLGRV